jgi:hypothetical protein
MLVLFRFRGRSEQGNIDRDYRLIGWLGVALVALGITALALAMVSVAPG